MAWRSVPAVLKIFRQRKSAPQVLRREYLGAKKYFVGSTWVQKSTSKGVLECKKVLEEEVVSTTDGLHSTDDAPVGTEEL